MQTQTAIYQSTDLYGLEEITEIYDYGNAGDDSKLEEGGIERLHSLMNSESMSAKFSSWMLMLVILWVEKTE